MKHGIQSARPGAAAGAARAGFLQRKCECGNHSAGGGKCGRCARDLQRQTALGIGASDDPLEHEADRVADQVLAGPAPALAGPAAPAAGLIRRASAAGAATGRAPASVERVVASAGQGLDAPLRRDMEQRFGHDFSQVRLHTGAAAAQSACEVDARAYTFGQHIVFDAGRFAPGTAHGRRLLAHELTHVVQQGAAGPARIQRQANPQVHAGGSAPAVPFEKTSPGVEAAYRRAGLTEAADAVRGCREMGLCQTVLTEAEALQMFSAGRSTAGLPPTPAEAGAAPLLVAPLAKAAAEKTVVQTAAERAAIRWAPRAAQIAAEAAPAAEGGAAAAGGAGIVTIAVPVAGAVYLAVAVAYLVSWSRFQGELRRQGYKILPAPLAVCIGNCHQPAAPSAAAPRSSGPGFGWPGPVSDADRRAIEEWLQPQGTKPKPVAPPVASARPKPVMPTTLSPAEQKKWQECEQLYDDYKDAQEKSVDQNDKLNELADKYHNGRATAQDIVDLCGLIDAQIKRVTNIHKLRLDYILEGCDQFDWFNRKTTRGQREKKHRDELDHVATQLTNLRILRRTLKCL